MLGALVVVHVERHVRGRAQRAPQLRVQLPEPLVQGLGAKHGRGGGVLALLPRLLLGDVEQEDGGGELQLLAATRHAAQGGERHKRGVAVINGGLHAQGAGLSG